MLFRASADIKGLNALYFIEIKIIPDIVIIIPKIWLNAILSFKNTCASIVVIKGEEAAIGAIIEAYSVLTPILYAKKAIISKKPITIIMIQFVVQTLFSWVVF